MFVCFFLGGEGLTYLTAQTGSKNTTCQFSERGSCWLQPADGVLAYIYNLDIYTVLLILTFSYWLDCFSFNYCFVKLIFIHLLMIFIAKFCCNSLFYKVFACSFYPDVFLFFNKFQLLSQIQQNHLELSTQCILSNLCQF